MLLRSKDAVLDPVRVQRPNEIAFIRHEQRQAAPLTMDRLGQMAPVLGPAAQFLTLETKSTFTIRATARVRLPNGQLSDMKRTVAAQIKFLPYGYQERLHVLRWYDTTWSN